jgi:hypothetical protein
VIGGAAGPIRAVAARTCDLMPVAARVAEILNPTLDLRDRVRRLAIRLTHGVPAAVVELAQLKATITATPRGLHPTTSLKKRLRHTKISPLVPA